jgi:hypothetical protein
MIGERVGFQGACQMIGECVGIEDAMIDARVDTDDKNIFS